MAVLELLKMMRVFKKDFTQNFLFISYFVLRPETVFTWHIKHYFSKFSKAIFKKRQVMDKNEFQFSMLKNI